MEHTLHKCNAAVIACIDWRIRQDGTFLKFLDERYDGKYDLIVVAGAGKDLLDPDFRTHMLKQLELSIKLHQPDRIAITAHMDCGAEGGSAAFENRKAEHTHLRERLRHAREAIGARFPQFPTDEYIIELAENPAGQWISTPRAEIKNPA